jgi:hypothetical protein
MGHVGNRKRMETLRSAVEAAGLALAPTAEMMQADDDATATTPRAVVGAALARSRSATPAPTPRLRGWLPTRWQGRLPA